MQIFDGGGHAKEGGQVLWISCQLFGFGLGFGSGLVRHYVKKAAQTGVVLFNPGQVHFHQVQGGNLFVAYELGLVDRGAKGKIQGIHRV
jgi:hypothetical protein